MLSNNLTIEINWIEILNIRELFEKAELILISNNWPTIEIRRWRRRSKTGDLHLVWMVTEVLIGRHPEIWIMSGDRPDVRGDRWVCEVFSASGFVQTQNGLVNGLCVWHWILVRVIDLYKKYICLAAENLFFCLTPFSETHELRGCIPMDISRRRWGVALCIMWIREPHTPVWTKNGRRTSGRTCVSF